MPKFLNLIQYEDDGKTATVDNTGTLKTIKLSSENIAGTTIQRDKDGRAKVATPVDDSDISTKSYTDEKAMSVGSDTLASAKSYTDEKAMSVGSDTLASAKSYTDEKASSTLSSAKSYTNKNFNSLNVKNGSAKYSLVQQNKNENEASAWASLALGESTLASGAYAVSTGISTTASGASAFVGGYNSLASGDKSFAFGNSCTAASSCSVALNDLSTASGWGSTAIGYNTMAAEPYSFTSGIGTVARIKGQAVFGRYNKETTTPVLIVGNGTSNTDRKNAFEVSDDETLLNNTLKIKGSSTVVFGRADKETPVGAYHFAGTENKTYYAPIYSGVAQQENINDDKITLAHSFYKTGTPETLNNYTFFEGTFGSCLAYNNYNVFWYAKPGSIAGFFGYNGSSWAPIDISAPSIQSTSDRRLKDNITPYKSNKSILDLPVYKFIYKSDSKNTVHIGCMAQDLQDICPEAVHDDGNGYLNIEESKIVYLLLQEVKKLKEQVSKSI